MGKNKLTPRREKVIAAIIETGTIEGASNKAGVSRQAIYNWLKEDAFRAKLEQERRAVFDEAVGLIKNATKQAAGAMIALLGHKDANVRRLTAKDIMALAIKSVEINDVEARLDAIEKRAAEHGRRQ
jgi:hypothetical protein